MRVCRQVTLAAVREAYEKRGHAAAAAAAAAVASTLRQAADVQAPSPSLELTQERVLLSKAEGPSGGGGSCRRQRR